jgi:hypothetical protein
MSFTVPFWVYTELGPAPILAGMHLVAPLVQRMLFIALTTAAQVSPKVFMPFGWLLANVHHIIIHGTHHTLLYIIAHIFVHHIHS